MKRLLSVIIPVILAFTCIFTFAVTANATSNSQEINMVVGETKILGYSLTPYQSSDTSVVEIRANGLRYEAVAVGKGSAQIISNPGLTSAQRVYTVTVRSGLFGIHLERQEIFMCIMTIALILGFSCVAYIFFAAPKCGMSRLWALAPLVSNVFGLIVFIVVCTQQKTRKKTAAITCPTCGGKHPVGTSFCSICGTKL